MIQLRLDAGKLPLKNSRIHARQGGAYLSSFKGRGMEFAEVREYVAGDDLNEATLRRVRASSKLIVIVGPNALNSHWVLQEVEAAIHAERPVIAIDLTGDGAADLVSSEGLHRFAPQSLAFATPQSFPVDHDLEGRVAQRDAEREHRVGAARRDLVADDVAADVERDVVARLEAARGELEASKARLWTANANLRRIRPLAEADAMKPAGLKGREDFRDMPLITIDPPTHIIMITETPVIKKSIGMKKAWIFTLSIFLLR